MSTHTNTTITFNRDDLKKLNVFQLRQIPSDIRYDKLKKFTQSDNRINLNSIIKRPVIPAYLISKYGNNERPRQKSSGHNHNNNHQTETKTTRRKIQTQKVNSSVSPEIQQLNDKIRDILSKLSESNKLKLFAEFQKLEIVDECGSELITNMYTFAIDLDYLVTIYAELINLFREKNANLYQQLIQKIIDNVHQPLQFDDLAKIKRWRLANIKLIAELYRQNNPEFDWITIEPLIQYLSNEIQVPTPENCEKLEVLCELLKRIIQANNCQLLQNTISDLDEIATNPAFEIRFRFLAQDVLAVYDELTEN